MFSKARLKLTLLYSAIFFILFWGFSAGLFFLMSRYLQGSYITQVRERHRQDLSFIQDFSPANLIVATTAGNVALDQLHTVLIYLNAFLLLLVPPIIWTLTGQTLTPLKEAHDREKQFVSDASHELKTPLSIMLGETEVALAKPRKGAEYREALASIKEEVYRLIKLVENLLLLARSDQTELATTFQPVDMVDTVVQTINKLQAKIGAKQLRVNFGLPENPVIISGNITLINQLVYNLIDNAIKYTPAKGKVVVTLSESRGKVTFKVQDSGIGIAKHEQDRIFDRFYRADVSRSRTKGYGLGLSISHAIAALHKGFITVASKPNRGSIFTVQLPKLA